MLLIRLAFSCVSVHGFGWFLADSVPKLCLTSIPLFHSKTQWPAVPSVHLVFSASIKTNFCDNRRNFGQKEFFDRLYTVLLGVPRRYQLPRVHQILEGSHDLPPMPVNQASRIHGRDVRPSPWAQDYRRTSRLVIPEVHILLGLRVLALYRFGDRSGVRTEGLAGRGRSRGSLDRDLAPYGQRTRDSGPDAQTDKRAVSRASKAGCRTAISSNTRSAPNGSSNYLRPSDVHLASLFWRLRNR